MRRRHLVVTTLIVVVLLVAGSGLAMASSDATGSDEVAAVDETIDHGDMIGWWLDLPSLFWWFLPVEDVPEPMCAPTDAGEATPVAEDGESEGCHEVNVAGPNGQVTHGSVVSAFVHSLKDLIAKDEVDYDGPRGHLVRDIARSDLGKDLEATEDDGEIELEAADDDAPPGPPDHARGEGRDKKDKPNKKPKK